jgi:hypothetical protein
MKWLPGGWLSRANNQATKSAEASAEVTELAQLLTRLSSATDGGGRRLLDDLISIVRRPGTGGLTGNMELSVLRHSPDDKMAQAAAGIIMDRARVDPAFSVAFGDWRRRDRVQEHLRSLAAERDAAPGKEGWASRLVRRRFFPWAVGAVAAGASALVLALITGIPADLSNIRSDLGQPVGWTVAWQEGNGDTYALAAPLALSDPQLAELDSTDSSNSASQKWFAGHGAIAVRDLDINLIVTGRRNSVVQVSSIQPVVHCQAALTGTFFSFPAQGGNTNTQLLFDLANPLTPAGYTVDNGGQITDQPDYFKYNNVTLEKGERFTFLIHAHMYAPRYCQFTLDMAVDDGGQIVHQKIDDHGRPFAVTGACTAPIATPASCYQDVYAFNFMGGKWQKYQPQTYSPASSEG